MGYNAPNQTVSQFQLKGRYARRYLSYDGAEAAADETGEKTEIPVIKVENTSGDSWGNLFTRGRFVFAVFFDWNVVYAAPSGSGTVINGNDYGNPAKVAYNSMTWHKYRSAKMFFATGQFAIDTVNRTIQVTKRILAVVDNGAYYWLSASEEAVPMLDSTEAEKHHMLILAYDSSIDRINLYNTAQSRALGVNGYYIAAWYENHFWYPHMSPLFSIVLDDKEYKAGALFDEERRDSYIEKKYEDRMQVIRSELTGKSLPEYPVVRAMGGVGNVLAPKLIAEIGDVRRFHSGKALIAHAGIDAPPYQSGQFTGTERKISKRGSSSLRKIGYEVMRYRRFAAKHPDI